MIPKRVDWFVGISLTCLPCLLARLLACLLVRSSSSYRRIIYSDRRELGFMINERRATTPRENQLRATAFDVVYTRDFLPATLIPSDLLAARFYFIFQGFPMNRSS